jgi:hypothetical protein
LFLMAGAMAVFMAASRTGVLKTEADQSLEAFRFSHFILSRVTRQASGVSASNAANKLVLAMPANVDGCQGELNTSARTNTLTVNASGALTCSVNTGTAQPLVEGIHDVVFTYGVDANSDKRIAQAEFVAFGSVTDWTKVGSVLVTITAKRGTQSGNVTSFVLTLRNKALSL